MAKDTIGERIKAFRLEREWNQARMAEFLGVSLPTVLRLEKRQRKPKDLTRAKIERRLAEFKAPAA